VVACPRRNGTGPDQDVSKSRIESRAHHDEDVVVFDQVAEDNRSQLPNGSDDLQIKRPGRLGGVL
jgi:hypothetical protein